MRKPLPGIRRSLALAERTEPMLPLNKTRDLARSLVASEADAGAASLRTEPATVRAYERLRQQLGAPVGVDGFQVLASRALALAKSQSPSLSAVQITADGCLRGLADVESQTDGDEVGEAGVVLIAQLLALFLTFLGEATTLRLIEDLRLQVEEGPEPAPAVESNTDARGEEPVLGAPFEELLLDIDRLRRVSEHIELLAFEQPGMEDGLVRAAGSIRDIATILDVFTLIRSKAGGAQEEAPVLPTNRYMN